MIQTDTKYYVYYHINLDNGDIFYVGKGSGNRHKALDNRSEFWMRYTSKYKNWKSIIYLDNLTNEDALDLEKNEIKRIGRRLDKKGTLVNILPGGNGFPESYLERRKNLKAELSLLPEYQDKKLFKREGQLAILYKMIDDKYPSINNISVKVEEPFYKLSYEEQVKWIMDSHNDFIENLKNNRKWAKNLEPYKSIDEMRPEYINKIINIKLKKCIV